MINYKVIGERIQQERKKKGLSQSRLAELLGISSSYVSRVERGVAKVSLELLSNISILLNIDIADLISNTSYDSNHYLEKDLHELLASATPKQRELIISIIHVILQNDSL